MFVYFFLAKLLTTFQLLKEHLKTLHVQPWNNTITATNSALLCKKRPETTKHVVELLVGNVSLLCALPHRMCNICLLYTSRCV